MAKHFHAVTIHASHFDDMAFDKVAFTGISDKSTQPRFHFVTSIVVQRNAAICEVSCRPDL